MNFHVISRATTESFKPFHPALSVWISSYARCAHTRPTLRPSLCFVQPSPRNFLQTGHKSGERHCVCKSTSLISDTGNQNLTSFISLFNSYNFRTLSQNTVTVSGMDLKKVVSLLEEFAPPSLAGSWDNVGLLVEPSSPHTVSTLCLTNDLTEEVLDEAIKNQADLILSYHPPIFAPLKRLTMKNVKERIVVRAIEKRIAIYSPHTSYDAVEGGVNDWLVDGLGETRSNVPLEPCLGKGDDFCVSFVSSSVDAESTISKMSSANSVTCITTTDNNLQITCSCSKSDLGKVVSSIEGIENMQPGSLQITQLTKAPLAKTGVGRLANLRTPAPVRTMIERIKTHLMRDHVQIALGQGKTLESEISTIGVCAGSGASVLKGVRADMFLTGEMSHHDILAAVAGGTTVIVCNHSNTERGYLHVLQRKFTDMFEKKVRVFVSEKDRDPLQVV